MNLRRTDIRIKVTDFSSEKLNDFEYGNVAQW